MSVWPPASQFNTNDGPTCFYLLLTSVQLQPKCILFSPSSRGRIFVVTVDAILCPHALRQRQQEVSWGQISVNWWFITLVEIKRLTKITNKQKQVENENRNILLKNEKWYKIRWKREFALLYSWMSNNLFACFCQVSSAFLLNTLNTSLLHFSCMFWLCIWKNFPPWWWSEIYVLMYLNYSNTCVD